MSKFSFEIRHKLNAVQVNSYVQYLGQLGYTD